MSRMNLYFILMLGIFLIGFRVAAQEADAEKTAGAEPKVIHVLVSLCDNDSQGIVPVPESLGDGDTPRTNLYWGAMYGVKTQFRKSADWEWVETKKALSATLLERCIFKHKASGAFLVADACRGRDIRVTVEDFVHALSGEKTDKVKVGEKEIGLFADADIVCYIGHNGLMDFTIDLPSKSKQEDTPAAVVLACRSKQYFQSFLKKMHCPAMLLTTGLMAPEAYTLEAALEPWLAGKDMAEVEKAAAGAYDRHQDCSYKAALGLFYIEEKEEETENE